MLSYRLEVYHLYAISGMSGYPTWAFRVEVPPNNKLHLRRWQA